MTLDRRWKLEATGAIHDGLLGVRAALLRLELSARSASGRKERNVVNPESTPDLPNLIPQTVFKETLSGEKFYSRLAELEAQGAKIETMEVGKGNGEWEIQYRIQETP